jgi:hypothetical protein
MAIFLNSGHIGIIVNESQSMVMFPMASKRGRLEEGEIDIYLYIMRLQIL